MSAEKRQYVLCLQKPHRSAVDSKVFSNTIYHTVKQVELELTEGALAALCEEMSEIAEYFERWDEYG